MALHGVRAPFDRALLAARAKAKMNGFDFVVTVQHNHSRSCSRPFGSYFHSTSAV
jgi:hypothetical protein